MCQWTLASDLLVGLISENRSSGFGRVALQRGGKVNHGKLERKVRNPRL